MVFNFENFQHDDVVVVAF